jgi:hypothetical protein
MRRTLKGHAVHEDRTFQIPQCTTVPRARKNSILPVAQIRWHGTAGPRALAADRRSLCCPVQLKVAKSGLTLRVAAGDRGCPRTTVCVTALAAFPSGPLSTSVAGFAVGYVTRGRRQPFGSAGRGAGPAVRAFPASAQVRRPGGAAASERGVVVGDDRRARGVSSPGWNAILTEDHEE